MAKYDVFHKKKNAWFKFFWEKQKCGKLCLFMACWRKWNPINELFGLNVPYLKANYEIKFEANYNCGLGEIRRWRTYPGAGLARVSPTIQNLLPLWEWWKSDIFQGYPLYIRGFKISQKRSYLQKLKDLWENWPIGRAWWLLSLLWECWEPDPY